MAHASKNQEDLAFEFMPKAQLHRESLREAMAAFRYISPYCGHFYSGLVTLFISALMRLLFPFLAGAIIDVAVRPGVARVPFLGVLSLNEVMLLLSGSVALHTLGSFHSTLVFNRVGQRALADLRREVYRRLIALPMAFFGQRRIGELSSRVSMDIAQIEGALIDVLPQFVRQSVFLLGGIFLFAATSGRFDLDDDPHPPRADRGGCDLWSALATLLS